MVASCDASSSSGRGSSGGAGANVGAGGSPYPEASTDGPLGEGGIVTEQDAPIESGCIGESFAGEPFPLDMFVMMDQSGSMGLDAGNTLTRWQTVKNALAEFVNQPATAGLGIGIQFFGQPFQLVPGCRAIDCTNEDDCIAQGCSTCEPQGFCIGPFNADDDSCDPIDYAWAEVEIKPLPDNGKYIIAAMAKHMPSTNTPTRPALQGAVDFATEWSKAHSDRITVVVLATDGEPSNCGTDIVEINAIAEKGFQGTPSVKTFVVGVGAALDALDGIAKAGGTEEAYNVDLSPDAEKDLLDTLNQIRVKALACTYEIPPPPAGEVADFGRVNVAYTAGDGGARERFPKVETSADCPATGEGWFYDDNAKPTRITLCPSTCDHISGDLHAQIDIVLGCITIIR
jgi:hypothetical protein